MTARLCQVPGMTTPLCYTGCALDRAARRRTDDTWLAERLRDPATRFVPLWRDRNLIVSGDAPGVAAMAAADLPLSVDADAAEAVFLGIEIGGPAWFAVDLSEHPKTDVADLCDGASFVSLRRVGSLMDGAAGSLLAYTLGMSYWHRRHRFCGVCGGPTRNRHGGHLRVCADAECGAEHFPRTDPAVIMLVTRSGADGDTCLLARQARWPKGMMSTLAGFVEPGESLEEAVAREVEEESGIAVRVEDVRYMASQPWPFPSSLMLGFRVDAPADAVLDYDADELDDARWYTRAEIRDAGPTGLILPGADSIARRLIETWAAEGDRQP
jgi:NAD+ diphosphatase